MSINTHTAVLSGSLMRAVTVNSSAMYFWRHS